MLTRVVVVALVVASSLAMPTAGEQSIHEHMPAVSGGPSGVPHFCAQPSISSIASGAWSDAKTWSAGRIPVAGDKVKVASGHRVTYDVASDAALDCLAIDGDVRFDTTANTRLRIGNLMVMEQGSLEVGNETTPVSPAVSAEIIITDSPIDREPRSNADRHGHPGSRPHHDARIREDADVPAPEAGAAGGCDAHSRSSKRRRDGGLEIASSFPTRGSCASRNTRPNRQPQDEQVQIASISEDEVSLTSPLRYDHPGARNGDGTPEFLPHVGNISRNVIVRSENPDGTRGHMIFVSRADVDIRYVELRRAGTHEDGRPRQLASSTPTDAWCGSAPTRSAATRFTSTTTFGPRTTPASGYQFRLIGNAIDGAPKWGITVHNSHYGLVRDNVVYNTRGAGIVTEDGTESFNVFEHNFSLRSGRLGRRCAAQRLRRSTHRPRRRGAGFWFRGPNNYIRNNVAANADAFGFGVAAGRSDVVAHSAVQGRRHERDRARPSPLDHDRRAGASSS